MRTTFASILSAGRMAAVTAAALSGIAASVIAAPARAESANCAPRDVVVDRLNMTYGEVFQGGGLQNDEAVFEVWISEADRTWTILMTRTDGMACIMAAGTDWLPPTASQQVAGIRS